MNNIFIILASGKSKRFNSNIPKQFNVYKNIPIYAHSIEKALKSKLFSKIILVTNDLKRIKIKNENLIIIKGGKERSDSSLNALKYIKKFKPNNVLIHDAARPDFSIKLLNELIKNLKNDIAVIPALPASDSLKYKIKNEIFNLNRDSSYLTQTPQAFRYKNLYELAIKQKNKITDEATLFIDTDQKVKFIKGEKENQKITFKEDIKINKTYVGIGFDIHRLIQDKTLYLGGIKIPFHSGLQGHSDGDVILHSIIDAILGALRQKDIGTYFPSNKNKFKNIRSPKMLKPVIDKLNKANFYFNNIDINLICERPKISIHRNKIIKSLSKLIGIDESLINLKGKTVEKLGLIGKEKAIACEVIVSISKYD
ncbi:2-C-methyl-D-erythritol 2,4-cyclodiphosphate synthase [Candidatus Pelagibacter sp.]|uniref:2-C-methyl-D-erythritol 2,4-cyclodiphosphate synthase n=1 Tax=Candidatus Pelagibacter sp. TaxID=2024849 RepID=UPI003F859A87